MISITDLLTPLTAEQVRTSFVNSLVALGVPADKWRKGGALSTILRIVAGMYASFTVLMADAIGAGFLETAKGPWLTLLASSVFGITRPQATFATGKVTLSNGGGGVYTLTAGQLQLKNATTGKAYTNTAGFTLNPGDVLDIDVSAVEIGTSSNADPGTVTEFATQLLAVTATNAAAITGSDAMTDADLRDLCSSKLGTLGNGGPRKAYRFAVRSATRPDGTPVNINRVSVSAFSSTGTVTIYVAAPSGAPDPLDVTYASDSVELLARPDGVEATVLAATEVPASRSLTLYSDGSTGLTTDELVTAATEALDAALANYPIAGRAIPPSTQGYLFANHVNTIAQSADPSIFFVDDGGAADVPLNTGEVAVLTVTIFARIVEESS